MLILGLNCYSHDSGAALVRDDGDRLEVVAVAEARLNRVKRSWEFPFLSIRYCLDHFGLDDLSQVDAVAVVRENDRTAPSAHLERVFFEEAVRPDRRSETFDPTRHYLDIAGFFSRTARPPVWVGHLDAHAAAAYHPSGMDEAAVLCIDGGGGTLHHGRGMDLRPIDGWGYYGPVVRDGREVAPAGAFLPNIGTLYQTVSGCLGVQEGTTMALASFAPRAASVALDAAPPRWGFHRDHTDTVLAAMRRAEGIARAVAVFGQDKYAPARTCPDADFDAVVGLARWAQDMLEAEILEASRRAGEKTGLRRLCLAGGVALSCVTNRRIIDSGDWDEVFIQPAASDEGLALGAALWAYAAAGGRNRWTMRDAYLGRAPDPATASQVAAAHGLQARPTTDGEVAGLLAEGRVVGRIAGRSEYGPRALGNRSLLADPRRPEMLRRMNAEIKHREWFRPFAPSCLEERVGDYFDVAQATPFMIVAAGVLDGRRAEIPAVTHVDGSSRPQTVSRAHNPGYHALISAFAEKTGVPVLLNTSFNDKDEPIVDDYRDALATFCTTGADHLLMDGRLVDRPPPEQAEAILRTVRAETREDVAARYAVERERLCDPQAVEAAARRIEAARAVRAPHAAGLFGFSRAVQETVTWDGIDDVPTGAVVHIYGAGGAGRALRDALADRPDVALAGFFDSFVVGDVDGVPVAPPPTSPADLSAGAVVAVASERWLEIALRLNQAGVADFVNATPLAHRRLRAS